MVVPIQSGEERTLVEKLDLHSPAWSAGGRWIAYVLGNQTSVVTPGNISPSAIEIVPAAGGQALAVTDGAATAPDETTEAGADSEAPSSTEGVDAPDPDPSE